MKQFFKCLFGYHLYRAWMNKTVRECTHCNKIQELKNGSWRNWKEFE